MYPINGITSVAPHTIKARRFMIGFIGATMLVPTLAALFGGSYGVFLISAVIAGLCIWRAIARKDLHVVMIHTAGGQIQALSSQSAGHVQNVVGALHNAIASRG
jgi:hypothetical protein